MPRDWRGRTAVYRLFDANSRLLYVGIGETAATRWQAHRVDKPWWDDVVRAEVVWVPTRREAEIEERRAIDTEGPLYNVAGAHDHLKHPTKSVPLPAPLVYVDQIAGFLDLSISYVRRISRSSTFPAPCERRRGRWLWRTEDVEAWAKANRPAVARLAMGQS